MAAIAIPDVDRRTLERLRDRLTPLTAIDLPDLELPGLDEVERQAGRARDRLTGRSRRSIWPRLAIGLGLLALVGLALMVFGSSRRSSWSLIDDDIDEGLDRGFDTPPVDLAATTVTGPSGTEMAGPEPDAASPATPTGTGLTAAQASLMSRDPSEEALS